MKKCSKVNAINPPLTSGFPSLSSFIDGLGMVAWPSAGRWGTNPLVKKPADCPGVVCNDRRQRITVRSDLVPYTSLVVSIWGTPHFLEHPGGRMPLPAQFLKAILYVSQFTPQASALTAIQLTINIAVKIMIPPSLWLTMLPRLRCLSFYCRTETFPITFFFFHLILIVLKN